MSYEIIDRSKLERMSYGELRDQYLELQREIWRWSSLKGRWSSQPSKEELAEETRMPKSKEDLIQLIVDDQELISTACSLEKINNICKSSKN